MPYPGGKGKIWQCPTAKADASDAFLQGGQFGFWSYVMDLDLKLLADINAHGVVGNSFVYPNMPKLSALRHTSQQVLLTEVAFSPTLEPYTSTPTRNGIFPAARWSYFSKTPQRSRRPGLYRRALSHLQMELRFQYRRSHGTQRSVQPGYLVESESRHPVAVRSKRIWSGDGAAPAALLIFAEGDFCLSPAPLRNNLARHEPRHFPRP